MAAHVAMAHYGLAAAASLGLERGGLSDIIKASSGRSFGFEVYVRLPAPAAFGHGAKLLAKDVCLLGDLMGSDPAYAPFRDVTMPFLELVTGAMK
jgi:hypothetical protein